jgi:very-short-patch-repair endonuclease
MHDVDKCVVVRQSLDGSQRLDPQARRYDETRSIRLEEQRIRTLRFLDDDVLKHPEEVCQAILLALEKGPHPNPLPDYRERE